MYNSTNPSATSPEKQKFVASLASQNYKGPSINDFLKLSGYDNSQESRQQLAAERGISGIGTAQGNTALLEYMRSNDGEVRAPGENYTNPNPFQQFGGNNVGSQQPQESSRDRYFSEYLESLKETPEERAGREYLNRLFTSSRQATETALNSGETLGYASGEAGRINRNNDITLDSASRAYDSLKTGSERNRNVSKLKYEYEVSKEKEARDAEKENKPFELSAGQTRYEYDPATKQYKVVASKAPKSTASSSEKPLTKTQQVSSDVNDLLQQMITYKENEGSNAGNLLDSRLYLKARDWLSKEHGYKAVAELEKAVAILGETQGDGSEYVTLPRNSTLSGLKPM